MTEETELNWYEVIDQEGEWSRFSTFEEAKSFFLKQVKDGEEVTLMRPDTEWSEENQSYETLLEWDELIKHHFICYFFYNDWSEYNDVSQYEIICFDTLEEAFKYQEENNSGGHLQFVKSEEWKVGEGIVNTILHDENMYPDDD